MGADRFRLLMLWGLGIVLAIVVPLLYRSTYCLAQSPDPFLYSQAAKEMLAGKRLYLECWQDKPPLAIVAYALPQILRPRSYSAIMFGLGLSLVGQGLLVGWALRSNVVVALAAFLFIAFSPMTHWDFAWPSTEHFSNFFITANLVVAYVICRDRRFSLVQCLLWGAVSSAAFNTRQGTVFSAVVPLAALLMAEAPLRRKTLGIAAAGAGFLAAWLAVLGLVAWIGDLRGYYHTVFTYPRSYARLGDRGQVIELVRQLLCSTWLPVLATLFAGLSLRTRYRWLAMVALVSGFLLCLLPMRAFPHYWVNLLPAIALLVGLGLDACNRSLRGLEWIGLATVAIVVLPHADRHLRAAHAAQNYEAYVRVAAAADRLAPAGATLLVNGPMTCEAIQFASRLPAAHMYSTAFQLGYPNCTILPRPIERIVEEYLASPPGVIVMPAVDLERLPQTAQDPTAMRLIRLLWKRYTYRVAEVVEGYAIAVRTPPQLSPSPEASR